MNLKELQKRGYKFMSKILTRSVVMDGYTTTPEEAQRAQDISDARALLGLGPYCKVILRWEIK